MAWTLLFVACAGPSDSRLGATREAPFDFSGRVSAGWVVLAQGDELGDARLWMTSGDVDCDRLAAGDLADLGAEGHGLVADFTWGWVSYGEGDEAPASTFVGRYAQGVDLYVAGGDGYTQRGFTSTTYADGARYEGAGGVGVAEVLSEDGAVVGTLVTDWVEAEFVADACPPVEAP